MSHAGPRSSGLHSLDQSGAPSSHLRFLDAEGARPAMRYASQRSVELLEVRGGGRILDVWSGASFFTSMTNVIVGGREA